MPKYLYSVEFTSEMTRVPLDVKGFEQFFYKGWKIASKKAFLEQHVGNITTYLMSKDEEALFRNIQTNIRNAFDKYAIPHIPGSKTRYFTEESLRQFQQEYKKHYDKYFELVEEFCKVYEKKRDKFLNEAVQFPETNIQKEKLYKKLKADIIPEKNFREKFKLNVISSGRIDLEDPEHIIQSNRSLGKALAIAKDMVDKWSESFAKYKGSIHYKTLNMLENNLKRMKDYDLSDNPDFQSIIEDFIAIKKAEGIGNTTKDNLKNIKEATVELSIKYDVTDMLK